MDETDKQIDRNCSNGRSPAKITQKKKKSCYFLLKLYWKKKMENY